MPFESPRMYCSTPFAMSRLLIRVKLARLTQPLGQLLSSNVTDQIENSLGEYGLLDLQVSYFWR